jgi:hypothetical protein
MTAPQDLAASALDKAGMLADRAGGLASAALERIEDLPEQALGLAGAAIPALRPKPKRSRTPWLLIAVIVAVVAGGLWYRRRAGSTEDVRQHDASEREIAAVS